MTRKNTKIFKLGIIYRNGEKKFFQCSVKTRWINKQALSFIVIIYLLQRRDKEVIVRLSTMHVQRWFDLRNSDDGSRWRRLFDSISIAIHACHRGIRKGTIRIIVPIAFAQFARSFLGSVNSVAARNIAARSLGTSWISDGSSRKKPKVETPSGSSRTVDVGCARYVLLYITQTGQVIARPR